MKKILLGSLAALALLLVGACAGLGIGFWRYQASGVNPLREIRQATWGESIEVKEQFAPKGISYQQLLVDGIDHGLQYAAPSAKSERGKPDLDFSRLPVTYYHPEGPVGVMMQGSNWFAGPVNTFHADARLPASLVGAGAQTALGSPWTQLADVWSEPPIGVIMLGAGTLAGYARPFQAIDFYERDPAIVRLSIVKEPDMPKFTYLADAKKRGAIVRIFEGNERGTFDAQAPKGFYRYLIVDTAHGHPGLLSKELLTQEAMRSYFDALVEDGIVAVHVSSRSFDLPPVVAATADSLKLAHLHAHDGAHLLQDSLRVHYSSEWMLLARKPEYLGPALAAHAQLPPPPQLPAAGGAFTLAQLPINPRFVWKDGGANSLAGLGR